MTRLRLAALTATSTLLGGCNLVVTDQPLFVKADAVGAPRFRAGIWNGAPPDCAFDELKPQDAWPKCANAQPPIPDPPPWLAVPGDPGILQITAPPDANQPVKVSIYVAFRVTRADAAGRATELQLWPVQCGPPPTEKDKTGLTLHLVPGLTERKDGGACTTDRKDALRNAARASEAWVPVKSMKTHWVRDPMPGDLTGPMEPKT